MALLRWLSIISLLTGAACAGIIALDVMRGPQKTAIMNLVWPLTALFGSFIVAWLYFKWGVLARKEVQREGPRPA